MNQEIIELDLLDGKYFIFKNYKNREEYDLIAYTIENVLSIRLIDKKEGIWSRYRFYQVEDLVFEFLYHEDLGNCLRLQQLRDKIRDYKNFEKLKKLAEKVVINVKLPPPIKEFRINDYITLKLIKIVEDLELILRFGYTVIMINDEQFNQCLSVSSNEIDEDLLHWSSNDLKNIGLTKEKIYLSLEDEFWGHCSNIQTWVENNYDTRLIHHNLAFPLLKRLTEAGDPLAKKVFKEEIAKRYKSGFPSVVKYLEEEGYLKYLSKEELEALK